MQTYLKIKIKSLASEARDIRKEERKANETSRQRKRMARDLELGEVRSHDGARNGMKLPNFQRDRLQRRLDRSRARLQNPRAMERLNGLREHRLGLRSHARSSFLAYGFIRGLDYNRIEKNARFKPDWAEVERLILKFSEEGTQAWKPRFEEFKKQFDNRPPFSRIKRI